MTEEEKPTLTHDQQIEVVITEVIKRGMFERVDMALRAKTGLSDSEIHDLIEHAQMRMVSSAPKEIRASLSTVISYHRWNDIYQKATSADDRITAQKHIDRLMGSIH